MATTMRRIEEAAKVAGFKKVIIKGNKISLDGKEINIECNIINKIYDIAETLAYTTLGDRFSELYFAICE